MPRRANYQILNGRSFDRPLVIKDVGPWDRWMTVTNAAEDVVEELDREGFLPPGRRLFYYDSEGDFSEIVVENGRFVRFGGTVYDAPR